MNDFIKNPQTRNARPFLPLNISAVGSVGIDCGSRGVVANDDTEDAESL